MSEQTDKLIASQAEVLTNISTRLDKIEQESSQRANPNSSNINFQQTYQDDEIDLRELWNVIWQGKWKIIAITTVFAIASVFYALSLPNIYKSEALLMPNNQDVQQSGLGALAGQFGGLASLAGINLGGGSTDKTGYALEVLKSRDFLYQFIRDNNLKAAIMAVNGWDRESNTFIYKEDDYDIKSKTWIREVKAPFKPEPSLIETYENFLKENLSVSQDKETGMVKLSINHYSPYLAKELVEKLISAINHTIKQQDMAEASKSIQYFEKELETTNIAGAQTMFYQLIEQQQQTLMLTKVRDDYVLKVVDRPIVAEKKDKPKRGLIIVVVTLLGGVFALASIIIRKFIVQ